MARARMTALIPRSGGEGLFCISPSRLRVVQTATSPASAPRWPLCERVTTRRPLLVTMTCGCDEPPFTDAVGAITAARTSLPPSTTTMAKICLVPPEEPVPAP